MYFFVKRLYLDLVCQINYLEVLEVFMKKVFKWIGIVLGSLIGLILLAGGVLFLIGNARLNKTYEFPPSNLTIPADEAGIARGEHRVETLCVGCHGDDLSGVKNWFDAGPIGTIDSANLTSGEGGIGREFTSDEDYVRAIRHGIDPEGKPILMFAVPATSHLSDKDLAAIIAYLKTVPPVDHVLNGHQLTPLGKIIAAAGQLGNLPVEDAVHETHVAAPQENISVEYGDYLVTTNACSDCHGPDLAGGEYPDPSKSLITPNLTPGGELSAWSEEQFVNTIKTGVTPNGNELDSELMPWEIYGHMTDDELRAVWMYLQSLPARDQYTR
jgi:mono/diheme cytochrome c family protein